MEKKGKEKSEEGQGHVEEVPCEIELLIDKEKDVVVVGRVQRNFIEMLYALISLPMGTIVKLFLEEENEAVLGSFTDLYRSVQGLDAECFSLKDYGKQLVLNPRSMKKLPALVVEEEPAVFVCPRVKEGKSGDCGMEFASFPNTLSKCRNCYSPMDAKMFNPTKAKAPAVADPFKTRNTDLEFLITDDLKVTPFSAAKLVSIYDSLGYIREDRKDFRTKNVTMGRKEMVGLLTKLYSSTSPLTDLFLGKCNPSALALAPTTPLPAIPSPTASFFASRLLTVCCRGPLPKEEINEGSVSKDGKFSLELTLLNEDPEKMLFAEPKTALVDCLLMFLALPLEAVWRLTDSLLISHPSFGNLFATLRELCGGAESTSTNPPITLLPWIYSVMDLPSIFADNGIRFETIPIIDNARPGRFYPRDKDVAAGVYRPTPTKYRTILDPKANFLITDGLNLQPFSLLSAVNHISGRANHTSNIHIDPIRLLRLLAATLVPPSTSTSTSTLITTALL